jgi:hypothetical protein
MTEITTLWIKKSTGVRGLLIEGDEGNPNTLELICPKGSVVHDAVTPALWVSNDSAVSDWLQATLT